MRVASPPDVTGVLVPMLRSEPAVMNLTVLPGVVSHPDGDAVHFDVLHGSANEVIERSSSSCSTSPSSPLSRSPGFPLSGRSGGGLPAGLR